MPAIDPIVDGDTGFMGVNMRLDPGQLPPGFVASARNKRFVNGTAKTRPGIKKMPWTNLAKKAWDDETTYNANEIVSYSGIAALVSGTESEVKSGGGDLTLQYAAPPDVQDGDFQDSSSTHWNFDGGWARQEVTSGVWVANHPSGDGSENLWQDIDTILGCKYTVTYTVSNWTAGNIQVFISQSSSGTEHTHPGGTATETFSDTIVCQGVNPQRVFIQAKSSFRGRVDNVSVVATGLPDQVDILGSLTKAAASGRQQAQAAITQAMFLAAALGLWVLISSQPLDPTRGTPLSIHMFQQWGLTLQALPQAP